MPHDEPKKAAAPAPVAEPKQYATAKPATEKPKPVLVHNPPHIGGAPHVAGEDPPEPEPADEYPEGEPRPAPAVPADNAQVLYGLRKEGRLFRCRIVGEVALLLEADTPELAKEGYCAELHRRRGEEPHPKKGAKKEKAAPAAAGASVAMPPLPPGFVAVATAPPAPVRIAPELVRCVKLAP